MIKYLIVIIIFIIIWWLFKKYWNSKPSSSLSNFSYKTVDHSVNPFRKNKSKMTSLLGGIKLQFDKDLIFSMNNNLDKDIFSGPITTPGRLFAIGDLHGNLNNTIKIFEQLKLTEKGIWIGGNSTCIILGDLMDRGKQTRHLLAWIINLQSSAKKQGGRIIVLMGNHELMNIMEDYRFVSKEDIDSFGGVENRKLALSHKTYIGEWLRSLPVVAHVNGFCFVHAGINMKMANYVTNKDPWNLNNLFHTKPTENINTYMDSMKLKEDDGILWDREMITYDNSTYTNLLNHLGVKGILVGHTIAHSVGAASTGNIGLLHGGRLALIDTGISQGYLNAVEITQNGIVPLYHYMEQ